MELPEKIFNLGVRAGRKIELAEYPLFYQTDYEIREAAIGGEKCIAVKPLGSVKPARLSKLIATLEKDKGLPGIAVVPKATAYQRRNLSEREVAWISSKNTFHIPFLAASSRATELRTTSAGKLSPRAQQVACHLIDGSWIGWSTTQIARELRVSLSSAVNYLKEIEAVLPGSISSTGRQRHLNNKGMTALEIYDALEPFMTSPVASRIILKRHSGIGIPKTIRALPASGITALSHETMIADDPWITRAVWIKDKAMLSLIEKKYEEVTIDDEPDLLLEKWRYDPGSNDIVDRIPLLFDLSDLSALEPDERIGAAIEELKKGILTSSR